MDNVFIKPRVDADGKPMLVRDPRTKKPLDANGEWKPKDQFWVRRIRDKDVVDITPKKDAPAAAAPAAPAVTASAASSKKA
jgi:hypothetical protein